MGSTQLSRDQATEKPDATGFTQRAIGLGFRLYKSLVSPVVHAVAPSRCLYLPTCSEYAYTALMRFGMVRGSWLAVRRFAHCHPWGKGGLDPVPHSAYPFGTSAKREQVMSAGETHANHLP